MSAIEDSGDSRCPEESNAQESMMSTISLGQLTPHDYDLQQSNLALLKAELKLVTRDRDILQKELNRVQQHQPSSLSGPPSSVSSYRPPVVAGTLPRRLPSGQGILSIDRSPSTSSVRDYEQMQTHSEAAARAMKESEYYQRQHRQAMTKLDSTNQEMDSLRAKYMDLLAGKQRLEQEIHILSQAREEDRKEINELRRQQQEMAIKGSGTSETLNQPYLNTLRKYEAIKDEHDSLRKRYTDLVASHSAAVSKLELAQEEMTRLKKQYEEAIQERNAVTRESNFLKQQCTHAIMQWDNAIRERNTYKDILTKMQAQHDEEVGKVMEIHMKASKDLKRLTDERNAAMEEYSLVMRERDTVHKEIEKLQDDLQQANKRIKLLETKNKELDEEKEVVVHQTESLRREILSALHDRDTALKELNDLREKYGDYKKDQRGDNSLLTRKTDYEGLTCVSDSLRKERGFEAPKSGRGESYSMDLGDQQEVEQLRKLVEKLQGELQEALQEAEVSKRRRDWAFGERDKVVLERESIRTLCDRLRRERDRAVSELAEALRDSDDIKRQRNEASKELKELKEKFGELQMEKDKEKEKDARPPHNHSYDSALGTDVSDAETETVEVEIDFATSTDDLGFSLAGGRSNPVCVNDSALYVVSISRGGPAEGKLRVSDCLVKVGNVSCATADSETAYNIIRTSKSPVVLTLKRRRSQSQGLYSVKLNVFGGVQHGLILENGIYIKSVVSGSIAARETTLKSGDRLCSINGRSTESFSGLDEVCRVLDELYHTEGLVITVVRGSSFPGMYPLSLPSLGSPSSSSSAHNITEDDNGDSQYSSSNLRLRASPRSDVTAAKSSKSSTSHRFNGSSNGGFGPWDMIRDRFTRIRRPHSKERVEHETSESKRSSVANTGASTEREAAIAELESVIDKYNQQLEMNSDRESVKNASSKPDFFTLNRRSRVTASQKVPSKREEVVISSGGTWPRCRAGSPLTSAYLQSGTMFNQKYSRGRPTLSIFSTDPKSSKEHVPEDSAFNRRSENVHEPKYHVYEGCNPEAGCLGSTHAPSDTSIDFSVKSGNMGKDVLEYYVKKKNPNSGKNDLDGGGRVSQASVSVSESAAPASGLSSPVHVHSSMPAPSHLRIHSQLYGCPNTIHSSIKYKLPHVHHPHNPPRYSSPPPLARPPSETYESPYMAPLSAKSSYSHAPSPSIDSVYSRPTLVPSHTHAPSFRVSDDLTANRVPRSDCVHLPFDSLNSVKRDPPRIRIPSNQSVTSRSSIEKLSERGSPMPNFHVEVLSPGRGGGDNRSSLSDYYSSGALKFKPALGELRRIYIEKSSKPLGIQIFCRNSGGVFVSSVHQPSLAAQVGLQVGDQLLEVCGINMRSATYQLAASVLRQCGDSVTMLVQYNLAKYQELTSSGFMGSPLMTSSGSEGDNSGQNDRCHRSRSGTPTPCNSPSPSRNNSTSGKDDVIDSASSTLRSPLHLDLLVERNSEARSSLVRPPSIHGTLTRHHALSSLKRPTSVVSPSNAEDSREPRLVLLDMKSSHNLGISLVGGNAFGIFVHAVQPDSSAHQAGLRCGDRILEFNGVNLRDATAEQAAYELAKPAEKVTLVVQHDIERYHEIAEQPGDSFYVRAQFDKPAGERADPMELYFRRDDILFIDNTMFNGVPGLWRAWLVDQEGRKIRCGVIPSKFKIEEEILQRSSLGDLDHDSRRSSTSARRSFFRRRKHNRSSSRDSKELASFSDASLQMGSAEGLGLGLICMQENSPQRPLSYVIVDRMDCHNIRPVLLVGPLADCVVDKLVQDFPRKFVRVAAEVMRVPQSYMEKGLEENVFVEYRRRGSHFECVTAAAVQEVCDKNVHGVLDISMNAVERLHSLRVYPIVLLLKFKSVKHVREVKDTRLLSDKMASKAAKEMYEHVIKVEAEHRHLVSSVVQAGGNLACICTQVATAVDQEQNKILWVPRVSTW